MSSAAETPLFGAADKGKSIAEFIANWPKCRPLQSRSERDAVTALVQLLGFESHHDHQKNWDTFKCLAYVLSLGNFDEPVLDAGSGARTVISRWLARLGYRQVYACDIQPESTIAPEARAHNVIYSQQDMTQTKYEDEFFQAITCISVIEHNVPLDAFTGEMARILKPGGVLAVSTDYWSTPVDCSGLFPYGVEAGEMKIFDAKGLRRFAKICGRAGLVPYQPIEYQTDEKAVRWDRMDRDYTFAFIAFKKCGTTSYSRFKDSVRAAYAKIRHGS